MQPRDYKKRKTEVEEKNNTLLADRLTKEIECLPFESAAYLLSQASPG